MIDRYLLPHTGRILTPVAQFAKKLNIHADQITLFGFFVGLLAFPALATQNYILALAFIFINRIFDGLDGVLARQTKPTNRGAYLDIVLDFLFYAIVPLGFAFADVQNAQASAVLLFAFITTGTSFLAFSVIAERLDLASAQYPQKGIYYLGGLTEGAETIAFFALICLFPQYFNWLAYLFAIACLTTAIIRISYSYKLFSKD